MKCWFFFFEGIFKEGVYEDNFRGLFSNALVPEADENEAIKLLLKALEYHNINLIQIEEKFIFDPEKKNIPSAEEYERILDWYNEMIKWQEIYFTPWYTFDDEEDYTIGKPCRNLN